MNLATGRRPVGAAAETMFLHAGQLLALAGETRGIHTIVGSCATVCLWHPGHGAARINHYVLPTRPATNANATRPLSYGEVAIPALLDRVLALGALTSQLEAKVFGGAQLAGDARSAPLGARNVQFAFDELAARGVQIVAHDVGGLRGRKLIFDPRDGSVLVKML